MTSRARLLTLAAGYPAPVLRRDEAVVVALRPRVGAGRGGGGGQSRRPRRPAAVLLPWPHPWRPRRAADLDRATSYAWSQYCAGLIGDIEIMCRDAELRALREGLLASFPEKWRPE